MRLFRFLLDPAPTEGGGTTTPTVTPTSTPTPTPTATPADSGKGYEAALKKHENDHAAMARTLHGENEKLRTDLAAAQSKAPKEGAIVLLGDDAARWTELGKLGTPEEIRTRLTAGETAIGQVSAFQREKLIGSAASAVGFDAEVLNGMPGVADLVIEVKDGTRNGKPAKIAEVVTKETDAKGVETEKRTPLDKFAETTWPKFLPALKAGTSAPPKVGGTPSRTTQPVTRAAVTTNEQTATPRRRPSF